MIPRTSSSKTPEHAAHKESAVSPRDQQILWDLEERFWTSGVESARATTAKGAVMIFAYPPGILQGDRIWNQMARRTGWRTVEKAERRTMRCGDIAILTYRVSAEKADVAIYRALCASTYMHDDGAWLRVSHQQTPIG